ncbi:MAG: isopentenyl phosphate kinase [Candidatus Micrarchaeota archaeon]|nr:isopentenyl phosphate kinase [Candidatus Micrarchaeota archaeon]
MQVVKLGGSAITIKKAYMKEDRKAIAKVCRAVAQAWHRGRKDIVLVHGAGSFGHAPVIKFGINSGVRTFKQRLGAAITHASCAKLSLMVVEALAKNRVPAFSIPPACLAVSDNRRIVQLDHKPVLRILGEGGMPVLYGDMVPDKSLGFSVCSGDQIAAHLGKSAERLIFATDVDGIYAQGKLVRAISRENFDSIKKHLRQSGSPDVTGGMEGKIAEISSSGKPAFIVNARKPSRLLAILLGKDAICTKILL